MPRRQGTDKPVDGRAQSLPVRPARRRYRLRWPRVRHRYPAPVRRQARRGEALGVRPAGECRDRDLKWTGSPAVVPAELRPPANWAALSPMPPLAQGSARPGCIPHRVRARSYRCPTASAPDGRITDQRKYPAPASGRAPARHDRCSPQLPGRQSAPAARTRCYRSHDIRRPRHSLRQCRPARNTHAPLARQCGQGPRFPRSRARVAQLQRHCPSSPACQCDGQADPAPHHLSPQASR